MMCVSQLLGPAVKRSLDLLNLQRLVNGADTYVHGYSTASLDPAMIILLTDGTEDVRPRHPPNLSCSPGSARSNL